MRLAKVNKLMERFGMVLSEVKKMGKYHVRRLHDFGDAHHHLEELGFVPGQVITVVARMGAGLIVNVKGS
ncbi:MAG: FeoA family protein, partial [Raoultibacter sp.]